MCLSQHFKAERENTNVHFVVLMVVPGPSGPRARIESMTSVELLFYFIKKFLCRDSRDSCARSALSRESMNPESQDSTEPKASFRRDAGQELEAKTKARMGS